MKYDPLTLPDSGCRLRTAAFAPAGGAGETHLTLHAPAASPFAAQLAAINDALAGVLEGAQARPVLLRYLLSDAANQLGAVREAATRFAPAAVSIVQQPPLDGSKVALWAILQQGMEPLGAGAFSRNGYTHLWSAGMHRTEGDSAEQTRSLLESYAGELAARGGTLEGNCIRTWFYVRDVDSRYAPFVQARRLFFAAHGLTSRTHYLASTGIEGRIDEPASFVGLDAYALFGAAPEQVNYLRAPTFLSATDRYGVTFERGTKVCYGDRSHLFISGTASIDHRGKVLHAGDVVAQTLRMWENVGALLAEGGASWNDVAHALVYLRDGADYAAVRRLFDKMLPHVPTIITLAPVCRPAWLIEMECMAVSAQREARFANF